MVKVRYLGMNPEEVKAEFGELRGKLIKFGMKFRPQGLEYQAIHAVTDKLDEAADLLIGEADSLKPKLAASKWKPGDHDVHKARAEGRE